MRIREAEHADLAGLLHLYTHLHDQPPPDSAPDSLWNRILRDDHHHILVAVRGNAILSSCVLLIVPNLTHGQRPYALVENVITHPEHRGNGYATRVLDHAKRIAAENGCYKIMLMTGSRQETTLRFYERAGYSRRDKTAFI